MEESTVPGSIAELAPAIHTLRLAGNGELWVLTNRPESMLQGAGADGPIAARCDVFSGEGEHPREVIIQIQGHVDGERGKWIWISDERVIILRDHASGAEARQAELRRASVRAGPAPTRLRRPRLALAQPSPRRNCPTQISARRVGSGSR
jgi:hypothetical protein